MKCVYCNSPLAAIAYCPGCGADVTLLKRIGRISNLLYNRGLEKAQVRDLSGAISCLKQSLKFNKENKDARNLLGLCYFETGEVVSALCEWVISKNMNPQNNLAEHYIDLLQNNKNYLDNINQSIRKYNQSVEYCRDGHEDMAVMQLKKVIAQNPKLVKAQQLLALLYMKNGDYAKARRILRKAAAVDNTNTTTLRYLTEIDENTGKSSVFGNRKKIRPTRREEAGEAQETIRYVSGTETIIQPTTFRDSSTVATFINIGLGVLLGGAIVWFMAIPASRQQANEQANQAVTDANLKLASGTAQLQDLKNEIEGYQSDVAAANREKEDALQKAESFQDLLGAAGLFLQGDATSAVDAIQKINEGDLDGNAKSLYDALMMSVSDTMFNQYYVAGTNAYAGGDYQTAAQQLQQAVDTDKDGAQANFYNAIYYLGFAYYNLGDRDSADQVFEELIERYPNQSGVISPYMSNYGSNSGGGTASQGEASMEQNGSGGQAIEILSYDPADVAWTDPNTGLHYDMYGNLLG